MLPQANNTDNGLNSTQPDPINQRTGAHYISIQDAIDEAQDGDTINVEPGTYDEPLDIDKNLNLVGAGKDNTIIISNIIETTDSSIITIKGFTIKDGHQFNQLTAIYNWGTLTLIDCIISNDISEFGCAGIENHGTLNLENCIISNNTGANSGWSRGGIENYGTLNVKNCIISNNTGQTRYGGFGGGIWNLEGGTCTLINSTISNNTACNGGGIANAGTLISDIISLFNIKDNHPDDFIGKQPIIHVSWVGLPNSEIAINGTTASTDFNGLLFQLPVNLDYLSGYTYNTSIENVTSFDLRKLGRVSNVEDQGSADTCWTFATLSSLESYFLPGESLDFSENNMKNLLSNGALEGFDRSFDDGGNGLMALAYLARWSGPVLESDDPYNISDADSPVLSAVKHVQDCIFIPACNVNKGWPIKWALMLYSADSLMKYGPVLSTIYWNDQYYNNQTYSYYSPGNNPVNHAISFVGWDDNYPASNFKNTPPGNGAFIVKNSWGSQWGDNGYFYISYYDESFAEDISFVFSNIEPADNYKTIYQYDPLGYVASYGFNNTTAFMANKFTSKGNDPLAAVSFYTAAPNSPYVVSIIVNDVVMYTQYGIIDTPGYHTIKLNETVPLKVGDEFYVVLGLNTPGYNYPIAYEYPMTGYSSKATANAGESYVSSDGDNWVDFTTLVTNANVCLKAFTIQEISNLNVQITSSNNQPNVGDEITVTYKLGNSGPDTAHNVTTTIPLPDGFELVSISGDGTWTYNAATRTITWTLESVPVGDPYLYIYGAVSKIGSLVFGYSINSDTLNLNSQGVVPILINAVAQSTEGNGKTIGMQNTGLPIIGLILAILLVLGGLFTRKL